VANQFLAEVDLGDDEGMTNRMCQACAKLHWTANEFGNLFYERLRRKVYTTPKSFLDMIVLYIEMLNEYRSVQKVQQKQLKVGVRKLEETASVVADLKIDLTKLAPVLVVKGEEATKMIAVVTEKQAKAEVVQARVEKDEAVVGKQAAETKAIADDGSGRFRRGNASVQERSQSFRRFREEGPSKRFKGVCKSTRRSENGHGGHSHFIRSTDGLEIGQRFVG
jgi:dynein heavy chain